MNHLQNDVANYVLEKWTEKQCNECKKHCCNQHSKELRFCYDCVEESVVEE